ncbi:MAG: RpiB/LacA/LacB family sugar-phosphate isomerase, partial [Cutibacterium avidum]|nr:RpiB/LacA/LacB family sugar-phosphate isomerase [Cutibacterium avidum]
NVVSLGGRMRTHEEAWKIVETFLTTDFSHEARHQRRIDKLTRWEDEGLLG